MKREKTKIKGKGTDEDERVILPLFYGMPHRFAEVMRAAVALNGSFFNTQRMVSQYVHNAYRAGPVTGPGAARVAAVR